MVSFTLYELSIAKMMSVFSFMPKSKTKLIGNFCLPKWNFHFHSFSEVAVDIILGAIISKLKIDD